MNPPKYKESFFHPHPDPLPSREREEYGGDFRGEKVGMIFLPRYSGQAGV